MQMFQREACRLGQLALPKLRLAQVADLPGPARIAEHLEQVAGMGNRFKPQDLDRHGGNGGLHRLAVEIQHGPDFSRDRAGDKGVPDLQGAVLNQDGCHRSSASVQLGFHDGSHGRSLGVGFEALQIGDQQNHLQQQVQVGFLDGGDFYGYRVSAPVFRCQAVGGQALLDLVHLGIGPVDLVDGHDHGNLGGPGMVDGLQRLRHHAVVGRHHQHDDVGHLGSPSPHHGEGFMARSVQEGDQALVLFDLVGPDVLGDASGFLGGDVGFSDRIQQGGLAVVHVAHDGDHRRPRRDVLRLFLGNGFILGVFLETDD